jgi:hypothetical protein
MKKQIKRYNSKKSLIPSFGIPLPGHFEIRVYLLLRFWFIFSENLTFRETLYDCVRKTFGDKKRNREEL